MKIGINASYAASEVPTGVGKYIINLIKAMPAEKNEYFLCYRKKVKKELYLRSPFPGISFHSYFGSLNKQDLDIFHDPSGKYIKYKNSRNIITVHDIVVALNEDYTSKKFKKTT